MVLPPSFTSEYIKQLELFQINARRSFLGNRQGGHLSIRRGHGLEFSDYRQYEPGDNPRHIDWGLYGRTDRLYVKRFREETSLHLLLVVDGSESLFARSDEKKWERARDLALSLGYIASMSRDTVSLLVPGYFSGPTVGGAGAIYHLARQFQEVEERRKNRVVGEIRFSQEVSRSLSELSTPGLVVLFSDCLMPLEQFAGLASAVRSRSFDGTLVRVSGGADAKPFPEIGSYDLLDSESGASRRIHVDQEMIDLHLKGYHEHMRMVDQLMLASRLHVCVNNDCDLPKFISSELVRTGLVQ